MSDQVDIIDRLRASVTQARAIDRSALLAEAAGEVEKLRGRLRLADAALRSTEKTSLPPADGEPHAVETGDGGLPRDADAATSHHGASGPGHELLPDTGDIVTRLRQTRANMLGTDDEAHYWDCHDAADEIERRMLTDAEREAIAAGLGALESLYADAAPVSRPVHDAYAPTLRALLERLSR